MRKYAILLLFLSWIVPVSALRAQSATELAGEAEEYLHAGEGDKALRYIDRALEKSPHDPYFHFIRGMALVNYYNMQSSANFIMDSELLSQSMAEMDYALGKDPEFMDFHSIRGCILYLGLKFKESEIAFREAITYCRAQSDSAQIFFGLARAVRHTLGPDSAIFYGQICLSADPEFSPMLDLMGLTYMEMERYDDAKRMLLKAVKYSENQMSGYNNLGFICLKLEEYDKAEQYFTRLIEAEPRSGYAYSNRSFARMKQGRLKEALKDVNQSIEIFPTNSWAFKNRALIYFEMGKDSKACEDLFHAREMDYAKQYDSEVDDLIREHCE